MCPMLRAVPITAEQTTEMMSLAQAAQDAGLGDSNDGEIDALRDALEYALGLLGLALPEGQEPDDD